MIYCRMGNIRQIGGKFVKKKVIILSTVLMLAAASVVSAASFWGKYKGFDIIRLTVDGKTVKANGTPALSLDGRTMVPINMLKDAGVNYSWDQETKTVAIKKQQQNNVTDDGVHEGHITYVKDLNKAMDLMKQLEDLGVKLQDLSDKLSFGYHGIADLENRKSLDTARRSLDDAISEYNRINNLHKILTNYFYSSDNINVSAAGTIINKYYSSIEYYKKSLDGLEGYWITNSVESFNTYLNNSSNGFGEAFEGEKLSNFNYEGYFTAIAKY